MATMLRCRPHNSSRLAGFSIVELMIAILVVGMLTAIGIPSLRNFTLQQRIGTSVQELQLDIAVARSEAITRAAGVSICTSNTTTSCTATGWQGERIIFADANQNGAVDGADEVIRQGNNPMAGMTITAAPAVNFISFNRLGQANAVATFTVCKTGLISRVLSLRTSGSNAITNPNATCP
jgi:Tfp pilus assembly protein FimT